MAEAEAEAQADTSTQLPPYRDTRLRSIMKAFSWRIIATLTTGIIAFFITGEVETAVMIGSIEFVLKFGIYYLHERAWQWSPK